MIRYHGHCPDADRFMPVYSYFKPAIPPSGVNRLTDKRSGTGRIDVPQCDISDTEIVDHIILNHPTLCCLAHQCDRIVKGLQHAVSRGEPPPPSEVHTVPHPLDHDNILE